MTMHGTGSIDGGGKAPVDPLSVRTVVVIDDHPVVALGIGLAFKATSRFRLAHAAATPVEALIAIEQLRPDVVISDLVFGAAIEIGLISSCRRLLPTSALVAFSSLPAKLYARDAIRAGADRFVPKDQPVEALMAVLDELGPRPRARMAAEGRAGGHASPAESALTPREMEVGMRLGMGESVARIGRELDLSAKTVAVHRDNIRRKLNCRDSAELIARLARRFPSVSRHD